MSPRCRSMPQTPSMSPARRSVPSTLYPGTDYHKAYTLSRLFLTDFILLGVSTAVIWIGLVVLALTIQLWTAGAQVERWRIAAFLSYRLPPSSRPLLC